MSENNPKNDVSSLPESWIKPKLSDVITLEKGRKPKVLENLPSNLAYPYINIEAFEKGIYTQYTDGEGATLSNFGDVLIVWDGARCGLVGKGVNGAVGSTLARLFSSGVNNLYLFYFLQSMFSFINSRPRGVGIPHVDPGLFWNIDFPLAPLSEQLRIVAKIEELFTQLDAAETALKRAKTNLERYQQSVLQAAVTGNLTVEWRTRHLDNSYEATSELPIGWVWSTVDKLAEHRLGKMLDKAKNKGDFYPYLRNTNVRWFGFDLADLKQIQVMENEIENVSVRYGDIVVCEGGEPGRCAVWESTQPIIIQKALHRIRVRKGILPHYITYVLAADSYTGKLEKFFTGSTIMHFTGESLKKYPIPTPPIEEQPVIIEEVDRNFSVIAVLEANVATSIQRIAQLRQSILEKAFAGKLVDQNPEDESAFVLLQRIQAEREEREKQQVAKPKKEKKKMTEETKRRSLFETLQTAGKRLTPEELFKRAGFNEESVDEFYEELRQELQIEVDGHVVKPGRIKEERPNQAYIYLSEVKS